MMNETELTYPTESAVDAQTEAELKAGDDQISLRHRLRWLMDKAPSDATASFFIKPVGQGYKGLLKIHSAQRRFIAGCEAASLSELMDRISEEIKEQLASWREVRFRNLSGGLENGVRIGT